MHKEKFSYVRRNEIEDLYKLVYNKKVLTFHEESYNLLVNQ